MRVLSWVALSSERILPFALIFGIFISGLSDNVMVDLLVLVAA